MPLKIEDLEDQSRFRQIMAMSYSEVIDFVLENIRKKSDLMIFFWSACIIFLGIAITVRVDIAGQYPGRNIFFHSLLGFVIFPLLCIPLHEGLHIIPYLLVGARNIRIGMDPGQYIFYVTAHRHVTGPLQFIIIASFPFILISTSAILLALILPGLWKWSLSVFLFVHATMCAGDIALLNFYRLRGWKKIYTWDDADGKVSYFYEKLQ
jgi:hypothetical protein